MKAKPSGWTFYQRAERLPGSSVEVMVREKNTREMVASFYAADARVGCAS